MTALTGTRIAIAECSAAPAGSARLRALGSLSQSIEGGLAKPYAAHATKRFAMAGIDTNVWPLGPQEWTSG